MQLHYCSHTKSEISETECPQIILALKSRQEICVCRECKRGQLLISGCPLKIPVYAKNEIRMKPERRASGVETPAAAEIARHNLRQIARLEELLLFSRSYF